tara:strand:- start:4057 stop:5262 length:1206 start_codon:yes stop_codon:yes gene_type:complete
MCGIYGIAKSPTSDLSDKDFNKLKKAIKLIAIDSEIRGNQSSGVATIGTNSMIYKTLDESSKFVKSKHFRQALKELKDNNILLGHTRFATEGAISVANAHPFQVGNTIGTHNGCVYNIDEMQKKLGKNCPVDSQLIFKSIDVNSDIQNAVKHFDSDFALAFVKDDINVLHLCREENRPLYIGYWEDRQILFYASEEDFLEDAFMELELDIDTFPLETNTLYSYDVTKFDKNGTNRVKTEFEYESRFVSIVNYSKLNSYSSIWNGTDYDKWTYRDDNYDYYDENGNLKNELLDMSDFDYSKVVQNQYDDFVKGYKEEENNWKLQKCSQYYGVSYRKNDDNWFEDKQEERWYYVKKNGDLVKEEDLTFGDMQEYDDTCMYCDEDIIKNHCGCYIDEEQTEIPY